ncbi:MAG: ECF transporter S component [Bacillota bacterium]|jgi:riboflavin transporter FmnP
MNRKTLPLVGILAAMSLCLELAVHFPVLSAAPYLLYSPGDLPILIAAIVVSPAAGVAAAFANATLFVMLTGQGGPWGALMHFIASGGMAFVVGWLYSKSKRLDASLFAGVLTRIALMVPLNLLVTPLYTGMTAKQVMQLIVPVIIPFNVIHGGLNSVLAFVLFAAAPNVFKLKGTR